MKYRSDVYKTEEGKKILLDLYDRQLATITVPFTEKFVDTRFGKTHLILYGNPQGTPVLGFHGGNATNPYSLRPFCKHVDMNKILFIVPDTIGNIGYSAENRITSSNLDYGKWASDILDALGIASIPVFGGSYGGGIAVRLAKAVSSMTPSLNDDFLEMIKLSVLNTKFEMAMPRNAKKKELTAFTAPTYVIAEEKDCLFPGKKVLARAPKIFSNLVTTYSQINKNHLF